MIYMLLIIGQQYKFGEKNELYIGLEFFNFVSVHFIIYYYLYSLIVCLCHVCLALFEFQINLLRTSNLLFMIFHSCVLCECVFKLLFTDVSSFTKLDIRLHISLLFYFRS